MNNMLMYQYSIRLFLTSLAILISFLSVLGIRRADAVAPPPVATPSIYPFPVYVDSTIRGSASYQSPSNTPQGISTYRWLLNDKEIKTGVVPQTLLLPFENTVISSDGQLPYASAGLSYATGKYGQALRFNPLSRTLLAYNTANVVDVGEGSISMWINLPYNLSDEIYSTGAQRLFAYNIDSNNKIVLDIQKNRIYSGVINAGNSYNTWPDPPAWLAGEWHNITFTWSTTENISEIFFDCGLVDDRGSYPAFTGTTNRFFLGTDGSWGWFDGLMDDVLITRRALSPEEIGAICTRGVSAGNDEVIFPAQETLVDGDRIRFELTPCDRDGVCGNTASTEVAIGNVPLYTLYPIPNLLPSGTTSIQLQLTSSAAANCRYSNQANTLYADMPYEFETGQGTTSHTTLIDGLHDLDNLYFYVRCASSGKDPDDYERSTHLRIMGGWEGDFPRIANLWGDLEPSEIDIYANYDLYVVDSWRNTGNLSDTLRALNPNAKILLTQTIIYANPDYDTLAREWLNSQPADPGYNCLLRDINKQVLYTSYWGNPMFNLTQAYCRQQLANRNINQFITSSEQGESYLLYDGMYWDSVRSNISWLSKDIDSDLDGEADDSILVNTNYQLGLEDYMSQMRERFPFAIMIANDAPSPFLPWLNGRLFEWNIASVLNDEGITTWEEIMDEYHYWFTHAPSEPHMPFLESSPESVYGEKYTKDYIDTVPPAMQAEAAASYQRMRFGLTSTLMFDGLFSYDYGPDWHGLPWWYDEYGKVLSDQAETLPVPGYLGQPIEDAQEFSTNPGVWYRNFNGGIAIVNTTTSAQSMILPKIYCKLKGNQAPLAQTRVDDDQIPAKTGWTSQVADNNQFGLTVQKASSTNASPLIYTPHLITPGAYKVSMWVEPQSGLSTNVEVILHHGYSYSSQTLDLTQGIVGWHDLGTYFYSLSGDSRVEIRSKGGIVIADAVKWETVARYNDGSILNTITVQAQDGIILLNECSGITPVDYPNKIFLPLFVK